MLMNTAKGYSALFPPDSQPIQGQGNMWSLSPGRILQFSVRLPVPRLCRYSQCIICSGFTTLLRVNKGSCPLAITKPFRSKFFVQYPLQYNSPSWSCWFKTLPSLDTSDTVFVPGLSSSNDLLGSLSGIITSGTLLSVFVFLSRFRSVWICWEVEYSLAWHLAFYHRPLWACRCLR